MAVSDWKEGCLILADQAETNHDLNIQVSPPIQIIFSHIELYFILCYFKE